MNVRISLAKWLLTVLGFLMLSIVQSSPAGAESESELAQKTQNPISDLISVPFQSNFNFGVGPDNNLQYLLNIQPVYPMEISENWNWINRPIVPVIYQPKLAPGVGNEFGLGDIQYQGYLSPKDSGSVTWGVGPVLNFPSATDESLGMEKWSAGAGAVALTIRGPWVAGVLVNNVWSYAGTDSRENIEFGVLQYFINYNFPGGLYLTSSPINTVDWKADSSERWTVPLGGGIGKILRIGKLPINTQIQGFYNVEHPDNGAEWSLRFQFQLLFPKG